MRPFSDQPSQSTLDSHYERDRRNHRYQIHNTGQDDAMHISGIDMQRQYKLEEVVIFVEQCKRFAFHALAVQSTIILEELAVKVILLQQNTHINCLTIYIFIYTITFSYPCDVFYAKNS